MVRFINRLTGSVMWVADGRKDEYLAAGHKLAVEPRDENLTEEEPVKKPEKATKKTTKKTAKKTTTKRK